MKISQITDNNKMTISLSGRLDTVTSPELDKFIEEKTDGIEHLVLDLKDLEYTSSAGLRVFLKAQKKMSKQGSLVLKNVCSDIMDIFSMTGFDEILTIE